MFFYDQRKEIVKFSSSNSIVDIHLPTDDLKTIQKNYNFPVSFYF